MTPLQLASYTDN